MGFVYVVCDNEKIYIQNREELTEYESAAIRADMTVNDKEFEGPAPFYQEDSKIVRQQYTLHREPKFVSKEGTLL